MKNKLLLPNGYKQLGLAFFVPGLVAGVAFLFFQWEPGLFNVELPAWFPGISDGLFSSRENNLIDEIALTLTISGLLLMSFSAEKSEDEFIRHTRLESLQWAVLINYLVLLISAWVLYNTGFLYVMIFNMLTILVIFLVRFHWKLYRLTTQNELP